jgi:glycosyltransferase involved in cell wall biosynthesis
MTGHDALKYPVYFVSQHNLRLTEQQLGQRLHHASLVRNPFMVPWEMSDDWPDFTEGMQLACVGRLYISEKGQDILLNVLALDKWRERKLFVTFYGSGPNKEGLESLAKFLELSSVRFAGFVQNVPSIWNKNHALILPSRSEGLPLVIVEAMLQGRIAIVTNVAGNSEVINDGETGFVAHAVSVDALDAALERAWNCRHDWQAMGRAASMSIKNFVPQDPARIMADILLSSSVN